MHSMNIVNITSSDFTNSQAPYTQNHNHLKYLVYQHFSKTVKPPFIKPDDVCGFSEKNTI